MREICLPSSTYSFAYRFSGQRPCKSQSAQLERKLLGDPILITTIVVLSPSNLFLFCNHSAILWLTPRDTGIPCCIYAHLSYAFVRLRNYQHPQSWFCRHLSAPYWPPLPTLNKASYKIYDVGLFRVVSHASLFSPPPFPLAFHDYDAIRKA